MIINKHNKVTCQLFVSIFMNSQLFAFISTLARMSPEHHSQLSLGGNLPQRFINASSEVLILNSLVFSISLTLSLLHLTI